LLQTPHRFRTKRQLSAGFSGIEVRLNPEESRTPIVEQ
jgi:hypothetical protein